MMHFSMYFTLFDPRPYVRTSQRLDAYIPSDIQGAILLYFDGAAVETAALRIVNGAFAPFAISSVNEVFEHPKAQKRGAL